QHDRLACAVGYPPVELAHHPAHVVLALQGQAHVLYGLDPDDAAYGLGDAAAHEVAVHAQQNLLVRDVGGNVHGPVLPDGLRRAAPDEVDPVVVRVREVDRELDIHRVVVAPLENLHHGLHQLREPGVRQEVVKGD